MTRNPVFNVALKNTDFSYDVELPDEIRSNNEAIEYLVKNPHIVKGTTNSVMKISREDISVNRSHFIRQYDPYNPTNLFAYVWYYDDDRKSALIHELPFNETTKWWGFGDKPGKIMEQSVSQLTDAIYLKNPIDTRGSSIWVIKNRCIVGIERLLMTITSTLCTRNINKHNFGIDLPNGRSFHMDELSFEQCRQFKIDFKSKQYVINKLSCNASYIWTATDISQEEPEIAIEYAYVYRNHKKSYDKIEIKPNEILLK